MEEQTKIAYHGTNRKDALNIVKTQTFNIKSDEDNERFLGEGAYFYFTEIDAFEWNIKKYRENNNKYIFPTYKDLNDSYAIIKTNLKTDESNILDLDKREDIIKYKIIVKNIKNFLEEIENYNDKNELGTIINYLYKIKEIDEVDAIQKTFPFSIPNSLGIRYIQKLMICIKNLKMLSEFYMCEKIKTEEYNEAKKLFM